jgi:flagella basal body P-ring formation protein FlgA
MTPLTAWAAAACLAVGAGTDEILVRDLAPAFANSAGLPLDTPVALAPAPGVQRRFSIAELRRLALRLHLPDPQREVCVERPVAPLDPARIVAAMQAQFPEARIELLDHGRYPVPDGELEFPRAGLRGAMWHGFVRYAGRHRAAVWARVKVSIAAVRVVAVEDLRPGRPIDASMLKIETRDDLPAAEPSPATLADVAGKIPRRLIRVGTPIRSAWLAEPKAVVRGETVQVEVREGGALLQLDGQAQASGAIGQTIPVLNTMSKKRFQARVEAKGKVSVGGPR